MIDLKVVTNKPKIMKQEKLAMCNREEFEQELDKLCPSPTLDMNPGDYDAAIAERASIRKDTIWDRIEALLDGKLTVDEVVEQEHEEDEELDEFAQIGAAEHKQ